MKREGRTVSEGVLDHVCSYTQLHAPGNPQQNLEKILTDGKPYVAPKTCGFCSKAAVGFVVNVQSGKERSACRGHLASAVETGKWRRKP